MPTVGFFCITGARMTSKPVVRSTARARKGTCTFLQLHLNSPSKFPHALHAPTSAKTFPPAV